MTDQRCAGGDHCYNAVRDLGEGPWLPSKETRIDGYCSCECRDFAEMREEHAKEVRAAVAAEREACAKIADDISSVQAELADESKSSRNRVLWIQTKKVAHAIAAAIRARSEAKT